MSSVVKWIIGGIAALVILIIIVIVCIPLFIDPNDYKDKITQVVKDSTGRELTIPGDIELSVSPTLKAVFSLGRVNLSSSSEFQGTEFFSSELVDINLALWPLISDKKIKINNLDLKGVNINLVKNESGATNWADLAGQGKEAPEAGKKEAPAPAAPEKPAKALPAIDIGGINIADINVTFTDKQAGRIVKLSNFNLKTGHVVEGSPFPFDANFAVSVDDGKKPLTATTGLDGNLTFELARMLFVIDRLKLKTDITGAPVPVKLFGLELSAEANLSDSKVAVNNLLIQIDDTNITGTASITDLANPSYKADLHIDQLNLDRYKVEKGKKQPGVQPEQPAAGTASTASPAPQGKPRPAAEQEEQEEQPVIPVDLLRGLTFDAEVRIDKLIAAKLTTANIMVKAAGREGLVQLQPFSAELYQGTITVNGDIDARPDTPEMELTEVMKGVELGPMFIDMKGKEEVKGTADIKADITTRGLTQKELIRNLNGTMNISLADGEIAKLKIIDTIRVAKRIYEAGSAPAPEKKKEQTTGRPTSFADLTASGIITNGVFKNDDLLAQSELMKVTGKGTVDLNTEQINYLLTIYLAKSLERDKEKDLVEMADTPIPYRVTGTFDKIDQSAALEEILKAGAVKLLSKELEKQLGGEKGKEDTKKDSSGSAEELINKGLKSLFGK